MHDGFSSINTPKIPLYFRHVLCIWLYKYMNGAKGFQRRFVMLKWNLKMLQGSKGTRSGVLRLLQHPLLADDGTLSYTCISTVAFLLIYIHQYSAPAKFQAY